MFEQKPILVVGTKSSIQEKPQIADRADRLNGLGVGRAARCKNVFNRIVSVSKREVFIFERAKN